MQKGPVQQLKAAPLHPHLITPFHRGEGEANERMRQYAGLQPEIAEKLAIHYQKGKRTGGLLGQLGAG